MYAPTFSGASFGGGHAALGLRGGDRVVVVGATLRQRARVAPRVLPWHQGLTLAHFTAQLDDLQDTSLTVELNLKTFREIWADGGQRKAQVEWKWTQ